MDYSKYLNKDTIEKILDQLSKTKPIIKPRSNYNEDQWKFFNENINNYMLNVALYILNKKDMLDTAFCLLRKHIPDIDMINKLSNSFIDICMRIVVLKSSVESIGRVEDIQVINYIYCELYCDLYKKDMGNVQDLVNWLEYSRQHVEMIITKEIKEQL